MELDRSMYYYTPVKDDSEVENKLRCFLEGRLCNRGCPEYYKRIRREGLIWNHKRVERVYGKMGLARRRKARRRIPNPVKTPLVQPEKINESWSMDFMEDRLENGRRVRVLNIIDDCNRQSIAIEVDYCFGSLRVTEVIKQAMEWHGKPARIRTDNGTEFMAGAFSGFCKDNNIEHVRIQKGRPTQNSYVERFNRSYREGVLDAFIFESIEQIRQETQYWMDDYNHHHPHESLGDITPMECRIKKESKADSDHRETD